MQKNKDKVSGLRWDRLWLLLPVVMILSFLWLGYNVVQRSNEIKTADAQNAKVSAYNKKMKAQNDLVSKSSFQGKVADFIRSGVTGDASSANKMWNAFHDKPFISGLGDQAQAKEKSDFLTAYPNGAKSTASNIIGTKRANGEFLVTYQYNYAQQNNTGGSTTKSLLFIIHGHRQSDGTYKADTVNRVTPVSNDSN